MNNILWLIRREIWENRSLWIAPLALAGFLVVVSAFGGVHVGENDNFWFGTAMGNQELHGLDPDLDKRRMIYGFAISMFTTIQLAVLGIVVFFYLLDSLLSERKDRSILFWKSLPLSDTEVVTSKVLTGLVVAPVFVLLLSAVTQLLFGLVWWMRFGGTTLGNVLMPWDAMTWLKVQAVFWMMAPAAILWYLPIAGFLLVVSVWARKNSFLWAVLPWVALTAIEGLLMQSHHVANFLGDRFGGVFRIMAYEPSSKVTSDNALAEVASHIGRVFTQYDTWLGVIAAAAVVFAAIRIRRYRDDS